MDKEKIIALRKRLGLTQKELAGRLKMDAITVSRWERETQRPDSVSIKKLNRLAKKAGLEVK